MPITNADIKKLGEAVVELHDKIAKFLSANQDEQKHNNDVYAIQRLHLELANTLDTYRTETQNDPTLLAEAKEQILEQLDFIKNNFPDLDRERVFIRTHVPEDATPTHQTEYGKIPDFRANATDIAATGTHQTNELSENEILEVIQWSTRSKLKQRNLTITDLTIENGLIKADWKSGNTFGSTTYNIEKIQQLKQEKDAMARDAALVEATMATIRERRLTNANAVQNNSNNPRPLSPKNK